MTEFKAPRSEMEWSPRAIINVAGALAAHTESLTLVGAHAVLLRTMDLDAPRMPTGEGDFGVTPGLVSDLPSIDVLLVGKGYEHRTTARPGLWGREPYDAPDGKRAFREKVDLLTPHGLSGTVSRNKRGVPALQSAHGKLTVGNALGLELAAFNRSLMTIPNFADPRLAAEIHVAEAPALVLAKGSKIGERLFQPRKGALRDKGFGDLWRLLAIGRSCRDGSDRGAVPGPPGGRGRRSPGRRVGRGGPARSREPRAGQVDLRHLRRPRRDRPHLLLSDGVSEHV
ncbi:hypothetical protein [Georgenia yuyongxinii]